MVSASFFKSRGLAREWCGRGVLKLPRFIKNAEGALFDILGEYTLHDAMISLQNRHIPKKGWVKVGFPCDPDMWTVCYNPELYHVYTDEQIFEEWLRLEVNDMSWTNNLPACPKCLVFKGGKPVSPGTEWSEPKKVFNAKKFHPNAVWEIRTAKPLKNGAGNQCTYDSSGNLITDEFGSGTADRSQAPGETGVVFQLLFNYGHIAHDVEPFELALDLDGGTHGSHVRQYISVRPFIME